MGEMGVAAARPGQVARLGQAARPVQVVKPVQGETLAVAVTLVQVETRHATAEGSAFWSRDVDGVGKVYDAALESYDVLLPELKNHPTVADGRLALGGSLLRTRWTSSLMNLA